MRIDRESIRRSIEQLGPRARLRTATVSQHIAWAVTELILEREVSPDHLKDAFRADREGTLQRIQPQVERYCRDCIEDVLIVLRSIPASGYEETITIPYGSPKYVERVVHLALERLLVHSAAPPLLISPIPEPRLLERLHHFTPVACVFDYPLAVTHEIYPLWTDSYVHSRAYRDMPPIEIVGVHTSWLDADCCANRVMIFDSDADAFLESPLRDPLELPVVLLLCQSPATHRELSARLTVKSKVHLNEYTGLAEIADDKWRCFQRWSETGIPTPATCLLSRHSEPSAVDETVTGFLRENAGSDTGWVIQPRNGTEGEGVTWISPGDDIVTADELIDAWREIAEYDDAILRTRRGMVQIEMENGAPRAFDIRINVSFDGFQHTAESGYLMVSASSKSPITSIARGGRIGKVSDLQNRRLVLMDESNRPIRPVTWRRADADRLFSLAAEAAHALGPLGLAGVDVKLDVEGDSIVPTVLDINPRPAGMLHADLLDGGPGEAGIAAGLWRRLAAALKKKGAQ